MSEIVLHQWVMSPFCNKIRRCLEFKGLGYQAVNYNGLRALQAAKLSPAGKLPVLDYQGERLQDSAHIARFLDQKYPDKPLYPTDPGALAQSRLLEDWAGTSLYFYELYLRMLDPVAMEKALDLVCAGHITASFFVNREEPLANLLEVMRHLMSHNGHLKTAIVP